MKMNSPKVSVIVPIYNAEPFLTPCLESIVNQTYNNLEIILVDDGSFDGSENICDKYSLEDERIMVFHQRNQGVVTARNVGIKNATGDFITFVDGDDTLEPFAIEFLINNIGNCDFISAGLYQELKDNKVLTRHDKFEEGIYRGEKFKRIVSNMIYFEEDTYIHYLTPFMVSKLYKTKLIKQIYSKIPADLTFAEDLVFTCANLLNCKSMVISHECLYNYRFREDSTVHKVTKNRLIEINKVYLVLYDMLKNNEFRARLLLQLERWVTVRTFLAVNHQMGFSTLGTFPEFRIDVDELKSKKIVLYGAGKMGSDCYRQLSSRGVEIVCWVDKRYLELRKLGMDVHELDEMKQRAFDLILIAVSRKEQAEEIKQLLEKEGIEKEKVIWIEPQKICY